MPLFRRADGDRVRDLPAIRLTMPLVMKARHEASMYTRLSFDVTRTLAWLERYNAASDGPRVSLFTLWSYACGRIIHAHPRLNRFAAGRHVYQRRGVWLSMSVKQAMNEDAPFVLTKLEVPEDQSFPAFTETLIAGVDACRGEGEGA